MGGIDKSTNIKVQSGKNKECVSEATISKLLNDFNCASLLTSTKTAEAKDEKLSLEDPHPYYKEIISSLKHLHIKRPVNQRSRLKEKKISERRAKAVSANKYNLSVAAINTQRPVVWPGRLNCMSKKTDSVILQPPRLTVPVPGKVNQASCTSSFTTSLHTSSSEEKSRIAAHLRKQSLSLFDDLKKHDNSQMSFSKLCKQKSIDFKERNISSHKHSFSHQSPSSLCNSTSVKSLSCASTDHQRNFTFHPLDHTQLSNQRLFSEYQSREASAREDTRFHQDLTSVCSKEKSTKQCDSISCDYLINSDRDNINSVLQPTTSSISPSSHVTSAVSGHAPERSCSEEVRMEESNVNELASYFEDLLYIPRKMSVMAEMMYA